MSGLIFVQGMPVCESRDPPSCKNTEETERMYESVSGNSHHAQQVKCIQIFIQQHLLEGFVCTGEVSMYLYKYILLYMFAYSCVYTNVCAHMCAHIDIHRYKCVCALGLHGWTCMLICVVCGNQDGHVTTETMKHSGNSRVLHQHGTDKVF